MGQWALSMIGYIVGEREDDCENNGGCLMSDIARISEIVYVLIL